MDLAHVTRVQVLDLVAKGGLPALDGLEAPPGWADIIRSCLAFKADFRPPARTVVAMLEQFGRDEGFDELG